MCSEAWQMHSVLHSHWISLVRHKSLRRKTLPNKNMQKGAGSSTVRTVSALREECKLFL